MEWRRRLPHLDVPGHPTFVTWCLAGSVPPNRIFNPEDVNSGQAFATFDHLLGTTRTGPFYLRQEQVASLVVQQLQAAVSARLCELGAYVVMPNHVHVLWIAHTPLARLVRQIKGSTARQANLVLGTQGQVFWQSEYYDHLVRDRPGFERIRNYIEFNPVRAGLVTEPEDFRWSSAWRG